MNSFNTHLKIMLLTAGCLFAAGVTAQEEDLMTEEGIVEEEGKAAEEGVTEEAGPAAEEEAVAEEGLVEEEGMLEEEAEELPPLYTSEIELGAGYSSADSFKFGEYNGLEDQGLFAIGNITLRKYSVLGDDDNNYWEFVGSNLGLDNRNIYMEYSHDGTYGEYARDNPYRVFFEYDQIPHNQFDDGQTPFIGAGTTNQTLPTTWTGARTSTGTMTNLLTSLNNVELDTERQRLGGGLKWNLTDHWLAQANYRHEDKDGADPIGAVFGSNGGNPRSSILAVPIHYDVDEFDAVLAYTGDKAQYSLNYHLSLFDNNDTSVFWENPFVNNAWADGVGNPANHPTGVGRLSLFPDNQAHQVNFAGGYNFTPKTRGTVTVSYGRWLQDQNFLPYTNLTLAAPPPVPLPRTSLDGDIATLFANLSLFSRLTNKLDLKAGYTFDDRDNNTPVDTYLRMQGDVIAAQPLITDEGARQNWNYDLTRHKFELDGGYRLLPMTKLDLGYAYERKERNLSEVDSTDEHTGKIRLSASPFDTVNGWVKYQHSVLDGSDYVSNEPFLTGHSPEHIDDVITTDCGGVVAGCSELFENDFLVRKFHFADRDRDWVQAAVIFYPYEKVDFSINGEYRQDDFGDTEIGLQKSRNYNATLDVNFHPNDRFTAYAFVTHENYKYDQRGYRRDSDAFGPGDPRPTPPGDTDEDFWTTDTEDKINMVGTGFVWAVIEDKFNLNLDFTHSRAYTHFEQTNGPNIAPTNSNFAIQLPDVTTRITNLSLTGDYKLRENMSVRLKYMYERFNSHDFGLDDVNVNTLSNVILLGNSSPDYVAHVLGISFVYEFQ